ncbi:MAG TPA: hypothetical protein H9795_04155 [Candidatus Fournierella merdigallinarum]|nr:hypothetical protein [Candidatus Fournierella merdigallinarum]
MDYTKKPFYLTEEDLRWVEEVFSSMTLEEKLNQVLVDMLWNEPPRQVAARQQNWQLGGYRYNNASGEKLWAQNQAVQRVSRVPALIASNVEAGGSGAVSGGTKLGEAIACAATGDAESAYDLGYCGCREAAAVGCNWTFAPVVDIDMNWRNCVIPLRCFGRDPDTVLMVGDAPGDPAAAEKNGVWFYPILVRREAESWARFPEALNALTTGRCPETAPVWREEFRRNLGG